LRIVGCPTCPSACCTSGARSRIRSDRSALRCRAIAPSEDAPIELADLSQLGDAPEVNEHLRPRQSQIEHRHQALAPGKHHAVVGILRSESKRLIERRRRPVVKRRGFHLDQVGWPTENTLSRQSNERASPFLTVRPFRGGTLPRRHPRSGQDPASADARRHRFVPCPPPTRVDRRPRPQAGADLRTGAGRDPAYIGEAAIQRIAPKCPAFGDLQRGRAVARSSRGLIARAPCWCTRAPLGSVLVKASCGGRRWRGSWVVVGRGRCR
jgi:hypothetical protein